MLRMEKKLNDSAETNSSLTENEIDISGSKNILPYQDSRLSFEERAADLVARMTLEEKAAQVSNMSEPIPRLGVSEYNYWREGLHGVARQGKATSFPTSLAMSNTWNRKLIYKAADITATEARGKIQRQICLIGAQPLIWQETRVGEEMKRRMAKTHI